MKTSERWRDVPSVPGLQASTRGRLRVIGYLHRMPNGSVIRRDSAPGFGQWDGKRFIYRLRGKTYKVARLVCEAFHGPAPDSRHVCMHLDENSRNNAPKNLRWGTQKENLNCPGFIAYCKSRTGSNSTHAKARAAR